MQTISWYVWEWQPCILRSFLTKYICLLFANFIFITQGLHLKYEISSIAVPAKYFYSSVISALSHNWAKCWDTSIILVPCANTSELIVSDFRDRAVSEIYPSITTKNFTPTWLVWCILIGPIFVSHQRKKFKKHLYFFLIFIF